ncbi:emp24/gp25L/p24 family/GOLD [Carpediemonas membranifera]|uniref:Emp24/gp25L/p24 family/GOLD n=1 Tax=Carpediemonas membranifera TaxID=201153 RepID=A0A8J6DZ66_9EUKA|nr:emp24/gp25L/p24 family/GOLD [Carpediemonas membranifera]|eukprot:KAG9393219.1 emp24/gp25L/p24 family/GOLD [Carpediemonas membranifera]
MHKVAFIFCFFLALVVQSNCLYWYMAGTESKEFYVDVFHDEVILVEYTFRTMPSSSRSSMTIPMGTATSLMIEVRDPQDSVVYRAEGNELGHFGFTSQLDGVYRIIFSQKNTQMFMRNRVRSRVSLDVTVGEDIGSEPAEPSGARADKAHIAVLTSSVARLKDKVDIIKMEQANSKSRDEKFSVKYAGIGSRIVFFALFQIAFFIGVGLWQMKDLKKFLVKTKVV